MAKETPEQTRRVQLTLPECERLGDLLFTEIRAGLGIPDHDAQDERIEIPRHKWADALPKIKRALKVTAAEPQPRARKGAAKTDA